MAVNPDPKPGRWILPLVILGMIAFTYFFVREIDEASTDTTLSAGPGGTGGTTTTSNPGDGSTSTTGGESDLDPATQAFLDEIASINTDLQAQRSEMVTVNEAFNEDPRGIEFADAESRFEVVVNTTQDLADRVAALSVPAGLESSQAALKAAIDTAAASASSALEGLRSTDTGQQRNAAVAAFETSAADFDTEVTNANNAARA